MQNKTLFQKVIDREIPADIIYEDSSYIAILDIHPRSYGHTLLITKEPYRWVNDVPNFTEYWNTARKLSLHLQEKLGSEFISYEVYGVDVPHCHIHILPRYSLDQLDARSKFPETMLIKQELVTLIQTDTL